MSDQLLVNGMYPIQYFTLKGVSNIQYPDQDFWASNQRFASESTDGSQYQAVSAGGTQTSEIIEIDFGKVRQVNYINFDVIRAPLDIKIEYDSISSIDADHMWVTVLRREDMPFYERIGYDSNNRNSWLNAQFYFTDPKQNMVNTRYLRITFTRRDEEWPIQGAAPFRWPVMIKQLRTGRYVLKLIDSIGAILGQPLHDVGTDSGVSQPFTLELDTATTTKQIRQRFRFPSNAARGSIIPEILGFGVLLQTNELSGGTQGPDLDDHQWQWALYAITPNQPDEFFAAGTEVGVVNEGETWLDVYLPEGKEIQGEMGQIYELRISSMNPTRSNEVFTTSPSQLSRASLTGAITFTNSTNSIATSVDQTATVFPGQFLVRDNTVDQPYVIATVTSSHITLTTNYTGPSGVFSTSIVDPMLTWSDSSVSYVTTGSSALQMRVWANIGDEGEDVLGNSYRYAMDRDVAPNVFDPSTPGWMSAPQPSPEAVEALYFDVRTSTLDQVTGSPVNALAIIDAVRIAPSTPGVHMAIYYTQSNLQGSAPSSRDDYDNLLWTPINIDYVLRQKAMIELPKTINASFLKLEFSSLKPSAYSVAGYPKLPPVSFYRYPTWVEQQYSNAQIRATIQNWFIQNSTVVQQNVLSQITDPVQEFLYEERAFLTALAQGSVTGASVVNSSLIDTTNNAIIDPTTASKIFLQTAGDFQNTLLVNVDQSSTLGQMVIANYDPATASDPLEIAATGGNPEAIQLVSTGNNRVVESFSQLANTPMRFSTQCRHQYRIDTAKFNKKAYFVGIQSVEFLRNRYAETHDNDTISDNYYDDQNLINNTWEREDAGSIPDGQTVYITYTVGDPITYTDEQVTLNGFNAVTLSGTGGQAYDIRVFSNANMTGQEFFSEWDYEVVYIEDEFGVISTQISRSALISRMTAPKLQLVYKDVGTVTGRAFIPDPPIDDAGIVTSIAVPINTQDGILRSSAATITSISVISAVEAHDNLDQAAVVSISVISSTNVVTDADSGTAAAIAVLSDVETFAAVDSGTVSGAAQPTATDSGLMGQGFFGRPGTTFGELRLVTIDAGTETAVAVPSAAETFTP